MSLREIFSMMARSFCGITTGMVVAFCIVGNVFTVSLNDFILEMEHIAITALVAVAFFFVFYSRKDISRSHMMVRVVIHFLLLAPTMIFLMKEWRWVTLQKPLASAIAILSFVVIYAGILFGVFLKDLRDSNAINAALRKRRNND